MKYLLFVVLGIALIWSGISTLIICSQYDELMNLQKRFDAQSQMMDEIDKDKSAPDWFKQWVYQSFGETISVLNQCENEDCGVIIMNFGRYQDFLNALDDMTKPRTLKWCEEKQQWVGESD